MASNIKFRVSDELVEYPQAIEEMEQKISEIRIDGASDEIWFLEHPPLYTAGSSAKPEHIINQDNFPTYFPGRGGQWTYHGPGQLIAYVMINLKRKYSPNSPDLKLFLESLESWIITSLAEFGITGFTIPGRTGVWVKHKNQDKKIAAIGVRIRHGISYHGVSLNVNPDLSHYLGIVPCGINDAGVTSMSELGKNVSIPEVVEVMKRLCSLKTY